MIKLSSLVKSRCLGRNSYITCVKRYIGIQLSSANVFQAAGPFKIIGTSVNHVRSLSASNTSETEFPEIQLDKPTYERVCAETLDGLCDYFEELIENANNLSGSDVSYSDGVLTVKLGNPYGTYVINRQTPNKQIWLSSPTSGPKRYDFVGPNNAETGKWIYRHNGQTMHELLQRELQEILRNQKINFFELPFGK